MQASRALARLAVVAILFAVCFALLVRAIGPSSPWLGLLLMFYFMGLAKVAEPVFTLGLPRGLRSVRRGARSAAIDRWLGVRGFGRLLRDTPLRHLNASVYLGGGRRGLAALRRQAASAEAIHFWAAVLFAPDIAVVWYRGFVAEAGLFLLVQVVVNVYPILHLRRVRARLERGARPAARVRPPDAHDPSRRSPRASLPPKASTVASTHPRRGPL